MMDSKGKYLALPDGGKLPIIGFGTYDTEPSKMENALNCALECGYRHVDTAYVYKNEEIVGKVLKEWLTSGKIKREDLFITTKLPGAGMYRDQVAYYLNESLKSLQLDYVDLYLIHSPIGLIGGGRDSMLNEMNPDTDFIEVWKGMEEQVGAKKARYIGLSNFNVGQIERVLKCCTIKPANLQIEIHLYLQQHELVDYCQRKNITVTAYSPLGNPNFKETLRALNLPMTDTPVPMNDPLLGKIAEKHAKTRGQILLKYLLQRGINVIPKSGTPSRILENISLFDFALDDSDMKELRELDKGEKGRICLFDFKGWTKHPEFPFDRAHLN